MKLRGTTGVALALLFAMPACSEEDTILSINVNLSASELNRQASAWEPIEVEITKGRNVKRVSIPLETGDEEIEQFDETGAPVLSADGKVLTTPATEAVKARFFERVTLDASFAGDVTITARATGAYKLSETVDGVTLPRSVSHEFVSGSEQSDAADADSERYTIAVRETPTPIEEEGVSAVFLDFRGPGPEQEEPPPSEGGAGGADGGSDSAGAGGESPNGGGTGGTGGSTGGSGDGGTGEGGAPSDPSTGGTGDGGTAEPGAGGEPASAGSPDDSPPAEAGSGGTSG